MVGLFLLLVVLAVWALVYSDMRKIHSGGQHDEPVRKEADFPAEPDAAHEPPPADAVREAPETMDTKAKSEAPADGGGR